MPIHGLDRGRKAIGPSLRGARLSGAQFQQRIHRARRLMDAVHSRYPGAWQAFDSFRRRRGRCREPSLGPTMDAAHIGQRG